MQARLGSSDRDAEGICDRGKFEVVAEAQNEQGLILRFEAGNQLPHLVASGK